MNLTNIELVSEIRRIADMTPEEQADPAVQVERVELLEELATRLDAKEH